MALHTEGAPQPPTPPAPQERDRLLAEMEAEEIESRKRMTAVLFTPTKKGPGSRPGPFPSALPLLQVSRGLNTCATYFF